MMAKELLISVQKQIDIFFPNSKIHEEVRIVLDIRDTCKIWFWLLSKTEVQKKCRKSEITSKCGLNFFCLSYAGLSVISLFSATLFVIYKLRKLREGDLSLLEIFTNIDTQTRTPIARRTNVKAMSVNVITTFF